MPHSLIPVLPLLALLVAVMIPVFKIFTSHQQRMAEILNRTNSDRDDIMLLRNEVAELKRLMHQQIIANDDHRSMSAPPPAPTIADRLAAGQ